jgi:hypothetical protein
MAVGSIYDGKGGGGALPSAHVVTRDGNGGGGALPSAHVVTKDGNGGGGALPSVHAIGRLFAAELTPITAGVSINARTARRAITAKVFFMVRPPPGSIYCRGTVQGGREIKIVQRAEQATRMEGLSEFQQNRRVIEDFVSNSLSGIPGDISRLMHVATLRDLATGQYHHHGLETIYSAPAVDQALRLCHEELFEKVLESSLEQQNADLRRCLSGFDGPLERVATNWKEQEFYRFLIPSGSPDYLRDLFCSNLNVLLQLILETSSSLESTS